MKVSPMRKNQNETCNCQKAKDETSIRTGAADKPVSELGTEPGRHTEGGAG